jgi:voltage-gated potassium channel
MSSRNSLDWTRLLRVLYLSAAVLGAVVLAAVLWDAVSLHSLRRRRPPQLRGYSYSSGHEPVRARVNRLFHPSRSVLGRLVEVGALIFGASQFVLSLYLTYKPEWSTTSVVFTAVFTAFFLFRYVLRLWAFAEPGRRIRFVLSLDPIVDLIATTNALLPLLPFVGTFLTFAYLRIINIYYAWASLDRWLEPTLLLSRVQRHLIRMALLVFAFLSTFGLTVALFESVGNPDGWDTVVDPPDSFLAFNALYFAVVSSSTVGYGDIVPITVFGRAFTVSFIVAGIVLVGQLTSRLLDILGARRAGAEPYFNTSRKSLVLLCGETSPAQLQDVLAELFHAERAGANSHLHAVILQEGSSFVPALRRHFHDHPVYSSRVTYLKGSAFLRSDLVRACADTPEMQCVFLLQRRFATSDSANLLRILAFRRALPSLPLYVMLGSQANTPIAVAAGVPPDTILAADQLRHGLLAVNCITPGASTLLINLFTMETGWGDGKRGAGGARGRGRRPGPGPLRTGAASAPAPAPAAAAVDTPAGMALGEGPSAGGERRRAGAQATLRGSAHAQDQRPSSAVVGGEETADAGPPRPVPPPELQARLAEPAQGPLSSALDKARRTLRVFHERASEEEGEDAGGGGDGDGDGATERGRDTDADSAAAGPPAAPRHRSWGPGVPALRPSSSSSSSPLPPAPLSWRDEYGAGLGQEVYEVQVPPWLVGHAYVDAVVLIYCSRVIHSTVSAPSEEEEGGEGHAPRGRPSGTLRRRLAPPRSLRGTAQPLLPDAGGGRAPRRPLLPAKSVQSLAESLLAHLEEEDDEGPVLVAVRHTTRTGALVIRCDLASRHRLKAGDSLFIVARDIGFIGHDILGVGIPRRPHTTDSGADAGAGAGAGAGGEELGAAHCAAAEPSGGAAEGPSTAARVHDDADGYRATRAGGLGVTPRPAPAPAAVSMRDLTWNDGGEGGGPHPVAPPRPPPPLRPAAPRDAPCDGKGGGDEDEDGDGDEDDARLPTAAAAADRYRPPSTLRDHIVVITDGWLRTLHLFVYPIRQVSSRPIVILSPSSVEEWEQSTCGARARAALAEREREAQERARRRRREKDERPPPRDTVPPARQPTGEGAEEEAEGGLAGAAHHRHDGTGDRLALHSRTVSDLPTPTTAAERSAAPAGLFEAAAEPPPAAAPDRASPLPLSSPPRSAAAGSSVWARGPIYFVRGSPLVEADLRRARVHTARRCVLFTGLPPDGSEGGDKWSVIGALDKAQHDALGAGQGFLFGGGTDAGSAGFTSSDMAAEVLVDAVGVLATLLIEVRLAPASPALLYGTTTEVAVAGSVRYLPPPESRPGRGAWDGGARGGGSWPEAGHRTVGWRGMRWASAAAAPAGAAQGPATARRIRFGVERAPRIPPAEAPRSSGPATSGRRRGPAMNAGDVPDVVGLEGGALSPASTVSSPASAAGGAGGEEEEDGEGSTLGSPLPIRQVSRAPRSVPTQQSAPPPTPAPPPPQPHRPLLRGPSASAHPTPAPPGIRWDARFAAGRLFPTSSLHALLVASFFNPSLLGLITMFARGDQLRLRHVLVPPELLHGDACPPRTGAAAAAGGAAAPPCGCTIPYARLVLHLVLKHNVVPMGLFRDRHHLGAALPYVHANPSMSARVRCGDVVFVVVPVDG